MRMASRHMDGNNMSTGMGSVPLTKAQIRDQQNTFFASKPEHRKGPNNILDIWKEFNIGMI